ncbi:MAG: hypothetical protein GF308_21500 [Candidatus Heimdallarchaeota archaeon]|nr:hypothetical protein [Candidatus Heimdallarchaeota archaeon]
MRKQGIVIILIGMFLTTSVFIGTERFIRYNEKVLMDEQKSTLSENEISQAAFKGLRSSFIKNVGQLKNDEIIYYGALPNGKIGFCKSKILLLMEGSNSIITLSFQKAKITKPYGKDIQLLENNFYLGKRGTYTNVPAFRTIIYEDLWAGITLYCTASSLGAKYEFHVSPQASPNDIEINYTGQELIDIKPDCIILQKGQEKIVDEGLKAFLIDGTEVASSFIAKGENSFGYSIGDYDQTKTLIIDPLIYSTYIGGNDREAVNSIAVDSEGNIYATGYTGSTDFPTENSYDDELSVKWDVFVFKLSSNGSSLIYSTYIGGDQADVGNAIDIIDKGYAYVTGSTYSEDFPAISTGAGTGPIDDEYNGNGDCFILALHISGGSLLYSTFLGGDEKDVGNSIKRHGTLFITGTTSSDNFPMKNAYDDKYNGSSDCFVTEIDADRCYLRYSTYFGGIGYDEAESIAIDASNDIYVTGYTNSYDFPCSDLAYDDEHNGDMDCFVFRLRNGGATLGYSTYVGGSDVDHAYSIDILESGEAFVTGDTNSNNFPTESISSDCYYKDDKQGYFDCFVFLLDEAGTQLFYSTYVGGSQADEGSSIKIFEDSIFVTGVTTSTNFPALNTSNREFPIADENSGKNDCFLFEIDLDEFKMQYSTYFGGSENDVAISLAIEDFGGIYIAGFSTSDDFPTLNAYDSDYHADFDCIVFKLSIVIEETATLGSSFVTTYVLTFTSIAVIVLGIYYIKSKKGKKHYKYR